MPVTYKPTNISNPLLEGYQAPAPILVAKYGKVTITSGYDHSYLGMRFLFNRDDETVSVSMFGFIDDTIGQYGVTGESACPAGENLFIIKESPPLNAE